MLHSPLGFALTRAPDTLGRGAGHGIPVGHAADAPPGLSTPQAARRGPCGAALLPVLGCPP